MLRPYLYGVVLGPTGEPLEHVTIDARFAYRIGGPPPNIEIQVSKTDTDVDGQYRLVLGQGSYSIAFCIGRQAAVIWTNIAIDLQVAKRLDAVVSSAGLAKSGVSFDGAHRAPFVDPSLPSCTAPDRAPRQRFYTLRASHGDPDEFCR